MENQKLPNSIASLVLGILSIVSCCFYGIGLVLGIIAVVLGSKALKLDAANPGMYDGRSNANTGKILGIIGIVLNVLYISFIVWAIMKFGWDTLQDQELLQQKLQEMQ